MVNLHKPIAYVGASCGSSAGIIGCENAPDILRAKYAAIADKMFGMAYVPSDIVDFDEIMELQYFTNELAHLTHNASKQGKFPIIIGGDHSIAMGSWAGIIPPNTPFGLIWIDAHFDIHTPKTSPSQNIHGMSVATLLGKGYPELVDTAYKGAKLTADNIFYIGTRCYEQAEQQTVQHHNIKVFYAEQVDELGFEHCLKQAISYFNTRNIPYGISFDVDSLDPFYISATGTPVAKGLKLQQVCDAFYNISMHNLQAFEIVEYNPNLEDGKRTDIHIPLAVLRCFDTDL